MRYINNPALTRCIDTDPILLLGKVPHSPHNPGHDETQQNARCERKIELKVVAFNRNIAR